MDGPQALAFGPAGQRICFLVAFRKVVYLPKVFTSLLKIFLKRIQCLFSPSTDGAVDVNVWPAILWLYNASLCTVKTPSCKCTRTHRAMKSRIVTHENEALWKIMALPVRGSYLYSPDRHKWGWDGKTLALKLRLDLWKELKPTSCLISSLEGIIWSSGVQLALKPLKQPVRAFSLFRYTAPTVLTCARIWRARVPMTMAVWGHTLNVLRPEAHAWVSHS